jgi:APA family basic amino acid/polyamine antiporter
MAGDLPTGFAKGRGWGRPVMGPMAGALLARRVARHAAGPAYLRADQRGAASSVFLMFSLPVETWERLALWLVIGLAFYFLCGVRHSRLAALTR